MTGLCTAVPLAVSRSSRLSVADRLLWSLEAPLRCSPAPLPLMYPQARVLNLSPVNYVYYAVGSTLINSCSEHAQLDDRHLSAVDCLAVSGKDAEHVWTRKLICSCARLGPCCLLLWGSASIQYRLFSVCDSVPMTSAWISQREMRFRVPAGLQQQQRHRALSGPIITVISLIATPVKMEVLKAVALQQEQRCSRGAVSAEVQPLTTDLLLHRTRSCVYYLQQGRCVSTCVRRLIGLLAEWHKSYWTDLHVTWMENESRPRIESINFGSGSRWRDGSRSHRTVSDIAGAFPHIQSFLRELCMEALFRRLVFMSEYAGHWSSEL